MMYPADFSSIFSEIFGIIVQLEIYNHSGSTTTLQDDNNCDDFSQILNVISHCFMFLNPIQGSTLVTLGKFLLVLKKKNYLGHPMRLRSASIESNTFYNVENVISRIENFYKLQSRHIMDLSTTPPPLPISVDDCTLRMRDSTEFAEACFLLVQELNLSFEQILTKEIGIKFIEKITEICIYALCHARFQGYHISDLLNHLTDTDETDSDE